MLEFVEELPPSSEEIRVTRAVRNGIKVFNGLLKRPGEWALIGSRPLKGKSTAEEKLACETYNALSNVFYYTFRSYIKFPRTETKVKDIDGTRFYYAKVSKSLWQKLFKK